jgi:hypothetical protein
MLQQRLLFVYFHSKKGGFGPAGTTIDPEWDLIDPAAGQWSPEMALDLVHNANPPLQP